ncbi:MAG TPA: glycosyltransferase family 39 protein [Candidatus Dormibacteraeota bacterium]|nr:glycosyltransferase family 39 protein [Candidatus Dormibacteraeota bacterium]
MLLPVLVLAIVASRVPLLTSGQFDYDEGVYWVSLRSLHAGNPIFISVFSSQPPAFLLLVEPAWAALGGSIAVARAVMLVFGIGAVISGSLLGRRLLGSGGAVALAALIAVDPLMLRQSLVLQAEGPAVCMALLSLSLASVSVTTHRGRIADIAAVASGAAIAIGILTKLFDVAAVPPLAVLLLLHSHPIRRGLLLGAGAVVAAALFLMPLHEAWGSMWQQVIALHVASRSLAYGQVSDPFIAFAQRELPLLGLALVGAAVGWRHHRTVVLVGLAWLAGTIVTMSVTHPLWPRHQVLMVPGACLLAAVGVQRVAGWLDKLRRGAGSVAVAILGAAAAAGVLLVGAAILQPARGVDPIIAVLQSRTAPGDLVLSDDQFATAAAGRSAPPEYVDTSFVRLAASGVTTADLAGNLDRQHVCAVVLATGRLAGVPGFSEWLRAHYTEVADLGGGRRVYIRPGCGAA